MTSCLMSPQRTYFKFNWELKLAERTSGTGMSVVTYWLGLLPNVNYHECEVKQNGNLGALCTTVFAISHIN